MITMTIDVEPVPWHRAEKSGRRTFQSDKDRHYQFLLARVASMAIARAQYKWLRDGEMSICIRAYRSTLRRCDVDNVAKNVMDALTEIAYKDDSQVSSLHVVRDIDRERPRVEIVISPRHIDMCDEFLARAKGN